LVRILQISDLHIVGEGELAYGVVDTAACLSGAVNYIQSVALNIGKVDGLLITGDLTDNGRAAEYERLKELLNPLNYPLILLPGNHDKRDTMFDAFTNQIWISSSEPLNSHHRFGEINVLALDCTVPGQPYGELSEQTSFWLREKLAEVNGKPVIIGLHHPPFKSGIEHMDAQPLKDPEILLEILGQHVGPKLVLCGHVHRYITCFHDGFPISIAPSVAHSVYLNQSSGAPSEYALEPGAFLMHEYDPSIQQFTSHLVQVGPHPGPYPFFGNQKN